MTETAFQMREFPELGERYAYLKVKGGPEVYVIPKERSQSYALLRVSVGGLNTSYSVGKRKMRIPEGAAHFLEHKLFANEDGRDSLEILGRLGANANAYTTPTSTCYLFSCRERFSESLAELLRFVSEPYFTAENIASERSVIEQEIAMYEDSPSSVLYYLALRSMYRTHPLRNNICGSVGSIARLTPKKLHEFYCAFYHPSRWQLFVSGRVSLVEIEKIVSAYSATCEDVAPAAPVPDTDLPHRRLSVRRMNVHRPLLAIGIKLPPPSDDAVYEARKAIARDLLHAALFGKSGEHYESLFRKGLLHTPLQASAETVPGAACVLLTGETADPEAVWEATLDTLRRVRRDGISERDFERMRRVAYADFLASLDSTEELAEGFCSAIPDGTDLFTYGRLILDTPYTLAQELLLRDYGEERMTKVIIRPLSGNRKRGIS